jgi:hypothetical protein
VAPTPLDITITITHHLDPPYLAPAESSGLSHSNTSTVLTRIVSDANVVLAEGVVMQGGSQGERWAFTRDENWVGGF